ncbi:MAG: efflux RND transporter permease subunit, partial [Chitinophagales bacterium]
MKIPSFAVRHPVTIAILVGVLIILGAVSYSKLAVDLYPEMKIPYAAVITSYSGAGPEEIESQVTDPIESVVGTVSNIKEIYSYSLSGSSVVLLGFDWGTDMDFATLNIREKLALIEKYLPSDADKPMVIKADPSMMPVLQIGMSGGRDLGQLQSIATDTVKPRLERIPGVASVTLTGGLTREVRVDVDPVKLENYGLTMSQLVSFLRTDNFNQAGGVAKDGRREYFVRSLQQFENVDEIRNVNIITSSGQPVRLSDVANVTDGYKDVEQLTRMNRKPSIGVHIQKQTDANSVKVSRAVREELKLIQKEFPGGITIGVVFDQADFINESMGSMGRTMLEGAALAMLVLFLFLRSVPSTLVIATSIPLSIIATFALMYFNNMTMNLITMGGVALGIGRIVDDSIVVLESIFRHRKNGEAPMLAAVNGASEVGTAVMAATFTTVAVFLPIMFVEGISSILFKPLALTVSFAILCSLVVALTIIPLLSSRMLVGEIVHEVKDEGRGLGKVATRFARFIDGLGEWYRGVINWALSHRAAVVIFVTVLMMASVPVCWLIGAEFIPRTDAGQMSISVEMDKGTVLGETDKVVSQIEDVINSMDETETIFTSVGSTGEMMIDTGTSATDTATMTVMLKEKSQRKRSTAQVVEDLRAHMANIPGAKITVSEYDMMSSMSGSSAPILVRIKGDDLETLKKLSSQVTDRIRAIPGTREVTSSLSEGKPEVQVKVDRERAASYGLTPIQVSQALQNAVQGTVATRYRVEGEEVDIRVRYDAAAREDITQLGSIMVATAAGTQIPLGELATFDLGRGPMSITHIDQGRVAEITSKLANGYSLSTVSNKVQAELNKIRMPNGYSTELAGEDEEMMDSFTSLAKALLLAILLVYAVMAIQYESFFIPFVIMFSVPTCFIGVVASLAITGRTFSVPAFIGAIMLVGIAVSNAIVLVDYIKTMRERGMERNQAIAEAGAVRIRPVLMTA